MSTKKLTLKSEASTRASDETLVIAARSVNDNIYPNNVIPIGSIYLANTKYLVLKNALGSSDSYVTRDASDNLIIANLKASGEIQLIHTMTGGNQRYLLLKEYGATDTQAIQAPYDLHIVTENGDINLLPDDNVGIGTDAPSAKLDVVGYALFEQSHGELYTYEAGVTVSATTAGTYYTITGITAGLSSGAGYAVVNATNGTITIGASGGGIYDIKFIAAGVSANKPCELHGSVFVNGTDTSKIAWRRDITTANQIGSASGSGLRELASGDVVTFRMKSSAASTTIALDHVQLYVTRISR